MWARITIRELATVLAALRCWQHEMLRRSETGDDGPVNDELFDSRNTPLSVSEIDALCERLNCS
jgi:hypothetical protein